MAEERLSFCMVTTFYPPYHFGGEAMYVYHLSNELARRGPFYDVLSAYSQALQERLFRVEGL